MPKFEFFFITVFIFASGMCLETYDGKYDSVDVEDILKSERLLTSYIKCLMDQSPCSEDGRDLKQILPDAIETDCSKCTEKQKEGSAKIMHHIIENRPDDWTRLEEIYDEGGKYRTSYLESKATGGHDH